MGVVRSGLQMSGSSRAHAGVDAICGSGKEWMGVGGSEWEHGLVQPNEQAVWKMSLNNI